MEKNTLFVSILVLLVGISLSLSTKTNKIGNEIVQNEPENIEQYENISNEEEFSETPEENSGSYQEALNKAKSENKQIVLFFTADWCGNCTSMKEETISSSKVQEALSKVVYLEIDVDNEKELIAKYKISGIPAYIRINANEEELNRGSGSLKENGFLNWLYKK